MIGVELYDKTVLECSKLITLRYSTSFSMGIKALDKKYHEPIYGIYGFVRLADEIVDTFHDHDKATLLTRFIEETYRAINEKISFNPVLHAFQLVVNKYQIEHDLIDAFLKSMEMDLYKHKYEASGYEKYIYGSAEVVGLMCLRIFCAGNDEQYQFLKPSGRRLGAAFQKVNFLRDMKSDFAERGRVYFPGTDFHNFSLSQKEIIEADIQADFDAALIGIQQLPLGARRGVYLAYKYYLQLFQRIKQVSPAQVLATRIRVPDSIKILLFAQTWFKHKLNVI